MIRRQGWAHPELHDQEHHHHMRGGIRSSPLIFSIFPRTPQVLSRVRYQRSKPNLSTFLQKVLPPISEIEPNQISIVYYIQHK